MTLFAIKSMLRQQTLNKLWKSNKLIKVSTVLLSATTLSTAALYAYESHKLREEERERQIQARIDAEVMREVGLREAIRRALHPSTESDFVVPEDWTHYSYWKDPRNAQEIERKMMYFSAGLPNDYDDTNKQISS